MPLSSLSLTLASRALANDDCLLSCLQGSQILNEIASYKEMLSAPAAVTRPLPLHCGRHGMSSEVSVVSTHNHLTHLQSVDKAAVICLASSPPPRQQLGSSCRSLFPMAWLLHRWHAVFSCSWLRAAVYNSATNDHLLCTP